MKMNPFQYVIEPSAIGNIFEPFNISFIFLSFYVTFARMHLNQYFKISVTAVASNVDWCVQSEVQSDYLALTQICCALHIPLNMSNRSKNNCTAHSGVRFCYIVQNPMKRIDCF